MEKKDKILYSESVKDIISNPPGKFLRLGTLIIFIVFIILLIFSYIIPYPDVITSPIEITTTNPPVIMHAKRSGRINNLFVADKEKVTSGQLIAVMETAASIVEIESLKRILDTVNSVNSLEKNSYPLFSDLGEVQSSYSMFLKSMADYSTYIRNDLYANKIQSYKEEINRINEYLISLNIKESLLNENLNLERKKFIRDSTLFLQKVYSESDLENSKKEYIKNKLTLQEVRLEHTSKKIELTEKERDLNEFIILREEEREKLESVRNEAFLNLKADLNVWLNQYLIISPINGTVSFTRYWSVNQSVMAEDAVLSIVPDNSGEYIGRISLKMHRSGKVSEGLIVNVKLSGYPYLEYGMIRGIVKNKSLVPSENTYIIEISFPEGLTTLYGKKIDFTHNMQGTAEIITTRISLAQRIINPFRYLSSKIKK